METPRSAGILLHPTSLPGSYGIGELGPEALRFVGFLKEAGQKLWQVLPLGPTGPEGSPYSAYSAFAGNPLLVSTDRLLDDGLLKLEEVPSPAPPGPVDYQSVDFSKGEMLRQAYENARAGGGPGGGFERFREEERGWLEDYALYAALKEKLGKPWSRWGRALAGRDPAALEEARQGLSDEILRHEFVQHLFYEHYGAVKRAANEAGIEVLGDLPIFVSHDSADVWANQRFFHLDGDGNPTVVAGVPPDYFSETGQLWGNPLYRWDALKEEGYAWWVSRLRQALILYDATRVDHFRGFESYWEVPATAKTAKEGRWVEGPGLNFFRALRDSLGDGEGDLPLIAEDLGLITPPVEELRDAAGLPGMKVVQFAFSGPENPYLPHNYRDANLVAYTATHDNDTTAGWWDAARKEEKRFARRYLGKRDPSTWDFIRLAHASVAARSVVPMQDVLSLGSEARMNVPGEASGNWTWRMRGDEMTERLARRLRGTTEPYGR